MGITQREHWGSKIGLVLAMAGNAIGLGNFLRFPSLAAQYGGGAFLIPYLTALLLLGIPLMWVEWSLGRFGGQFGHSTTPGIFAHLWRSRWAKYVGALGIALPLLFTVFYTYVESWTLAYSVFSVTKWYYPADPQQALGEVPPEVPGINAARLRDVLKRCDKDRDGILSAKEWPTGAEGESLRRLDANHDGTLDQQELDVVLDPLGRAHTRQFLQDYQGASQPEDFQFFHSLWPAIGFWLATVLLNCWVISRGLSGGIERLAKVAMPLLFLFAVVLAVRVLTYGTPDPAHPDRSVWVGLNYVWQPNLSALADFRVWLAAAGQIFFTLSIGNGSIQCYASYLRHDEDCALTGLTTAATNEFAEIVLGGTIAIPIAVAIFGLTNTQAIAAQSPYDLGFVAMPIIFEQLPGGFLFGTLWFLLLFFAGITSSVALSQPLVAFLEDEFGLSRRVSAVVCGALMIGLGLPIVLFFKTGYLGQYDFWVGTFGLVVFALLESLLFAWVFGGERMWAEIQHAAAIRIPRVFYYLIRYVVPLYLVVLLVGWLVQSFGDAILLRGVPPQNVPYLWLARLTIVGLIAAAVGLVAAAWRRRARRGEPEAVP